MQKKFIPLAVAAVLSACVALSASAEEVHVFLLAGQSNMVGRDATPFNFEPNPSILNFTDGRAGTPLNQVEIAQDPIRHDKDGVTYGTNAGRPFAEALLKTLPEGDKILLVNRAWGGTDISEWRKGHGPKGYSPDSGYNLPVNPYVSAIEATKAAMQAVTDSGREVSLDGILWIQGESDVDHLTCPQMYEAAVVDVLTNMRKDLNDPDLKIVIGEFYQDYGGEAGKLILNTLPKIAKRLNAGLAKSTGAQVLADGVHMTTASHQALGERMAEEYLKLK
ncbi:MAG: sialate O-acetylesterase [Candidatus Anaerobiospirillum merdipullorum]|uniref:Sialate O-acetylesterase n=1 Tax=Candidatus Anaerobiospirillum merdipullorum TaxID=2838450 RepID=A0A9E2KNL0_9GAMM|nr:sialate O-acetylesterase [Candidatus Anaerobiospirillum merdipullorum]